MNRVVFCIDFAFEALFPDCFRNSGRLNLTLDNVNRPGSTRHASSNRTTTRPPKEKANWLSNALRLAAGLLLFPFILLALLVNSTSSAETTANLSGLCNGFCPRATLPPFANPSPREFIHADSPWNNFVVRVSNSHPNGFSNCTDLGSGVIIQNNSGQKFVLTAAHIFNDGSGNVFVRANNGFQSRAEPVLLDRIWDIAVLKINSPPPAPGIPFAPNAPTPGDEMFIAGFGSDNRLAATHGLVIGYTQSVRSGKRETLKTTGAVRQGDSGGPVLNRRGELIGVVWGTDGQHSYATYSGRIKKLLAENPALLFEPTLPHSPQTLPPNDAMNNELNDSPHRIVEDNVPAAEQVDHASENSPNPPAERVAPEDSSSTTDQAVSQNTQSPILIDRPPSTDATGDPAEIILGWTLKFLLPALGVTVPSTLLTAYAFWKIAHRLRKRVHRRKKNRNNPQTYDPKSANSLSDTRNRLEKVAQAAANTIVNSHNDYALELNDLYNLNGRNSVADATLGRLYDSELAQHESSSNPQLAQFASDLRRKIKKELCRIHSESPVPVSEGES